MIAQIAAGDRLLREIDSEFSGQKPNSEGGASPACVTRVDQRYGDDRRPRERTAEGRAREVIVIGVWSSQSDFGAVTPVGWISEEAIVHEGRVSGHLWRFRNYARARFWHDELHRAGFHVWGEGATCQTKT